MLKPALVVVAFAGSPCCFVSPQITESCVAECWSRVLPTVALEASKCQPPSPLNVPSYLPWACADTSPLCPFVTALPDNKTWDTMSCFPKNELPKRSLLLVLGGSSSCEGVLRAGHRCSCFSGGKQSSPQNQRRWVWPYTGLVCSEAASPDSLTDLGLA